MNNLFEVGKNMLNGKIKKQIMIGVLAILPFLGIVIIGALIAMMAIAPILQSLEAIDTYGKSITGFFQKTGNLLAGRGFQQITDEVVAAKEQAFNEKLKELYVKYYAKGVAIDAPLILATVYYPMSITYDENTFACVNGIDLEGNECDISGQDSNKDQYDMWEDRTKKLPELINHSISMTETIYACEAVSTNSKGETVYAQGNQVGEPIYTYPLKTIKEDETCSSSSSISKYTYTLEPDKYDNYLAAIPDGYIITREEYEFPKNITDDNEKQFKLDQIVIAIHDLSDFYKNMFEVPAGMLSGVSSLCPTGITVTGSLDSGTYSLEEYVAGVISAENAFTDSNNPSNIESMKAQAVAARTYVIKQSNYCSKAIGDSSSYQNFTKNIGDKARQAASETAGKVLTYQGNIFMSEYDSFYCNNSCVGGQECSCIYKKEPFIDATGNVTWDPSRAVNTHVVTIPASMSWRAAGGHGHGMSQLGANYLQTLGWTYDRILKYFYADGIEITQFVGSENGTDGMVTVRDGTFIIPSGVQSGTDGTKGSGPNNFNIYFWNRLSPLIDAAKAAGYEIGITDAWRSYEAQVDCEREKPTLCATPGTSLHGWGIAADLNFYQVNAATEWVHAHAIQYGLEFPMDYEPWHIQPISIERS